MWQYIIVAIIIAWAVYYIWKTYARKKGCACGNETCTTARPGQPGCCSGQDSIDPMPKDTPSAQSSEKNGQR